MSVPPGESPDARFLDLQSRLQLLRCVACAAEALEIRPASPNQWPNLKLALADRVVACGACGECYPLTEDVIPIFWTPPLRGYLESRDPLASVLAANAAIYDQNSSDYARYSRQYPKTAQRIQLAARRLLNGRPAPRRHLDFGCGPGHVMIWLRELGLEHFGLDVSLSNLRNARRQTGAFVVLGSADRMPFRDGVFDLVTESSVLHHIADWLGTVDETTRVCAPGGGVFFDSEPSKDGKNWGPLARAVFNARWYPYSLMSRFMPSKYMFRDVKMAKLNFRDAEIHNQPGGGFPLDELGRRFSAAGFECEIIQSPDENLQTRANPSWQTTLLHLLSGHNPWNPRYGMFSVLARKHA